MIVVPNEGELWLLDLLLRETVPSTLKFVLRLYRNDWTPEKDSVRADASEATFAGYLPVEMDRAAWTAAQLVGGEAQSTYGTLYQQWLASSGNQLIYGYFVTDEDDNFILWAERFVTAVNVSAVTPVVMMPVLRLHSEFQPP